MDFFTIFCCAIIIAAFCWALWFINKTEDNVLPKKRQWIAQLPSLISTLGVLGTFAGITKGLLKFDTSALDASIPELLNGMKTAFFTSLFGMIGSLILSRRVSLKFDTTKALSETQQAASDITAAVKAAQAAITKVIADSHSDLGNVLSKNNAEIVKAFAQEATIKAIRQDLEQIKDDVEETKGHIEELKSTVGSIETFTQATTEETSRLRAVLLTTAESVSKMDNAVAEISEGVSALKAKSEEAIETMTTED